MRKSKAVGPDYPNDRFENPVNAGIEEWYPDGDGKKSLVSPNEQTVTGVGLPLHKGTYDKLYEGK